MSSVRSNEIIMLDDNEQDRFISKICFEKSQLTNKFMTFDCGESLLQYMEEVETGIHLMPALILLDINMQGMNGLDVLKIIRSKKTFAKDPLIIILTTSDREADKVRSMELGANGYQVKPFSVDEYVNFFNSLASL